MKGSEKKVPDDAKNVEAACKARAPTAATDARMPRDTAGAEVPAEPVTEWLFKYWPWYKAPPNGWEIVDDMHDCHHGAHAVLLRKKG